MPTYRIKYLSRRGQRRSELMDAIDPAQVRENLVARGCWVSTIELHTKRRYRHDKVRVPRKQLVMSLEALKLLVSSGAKIDRAIRAAVEQAPPGKLRYVLASIAEGTEGGDFVANFEQFKNVFPEAVVEILKANQVAGNIELGLEQVCSYYTRMEEIRGNVLRGLFVPIVGFSAFVMASGVIFGITLPRFKKMFAELLPPKEMPVLTRSFFAVSDFFVDHPTFVIVGLCAAAFGVWRLLKKRPVQRVIMRVAQKLPLLGPAIQATAIARFSTTYADLTKAGFKTILVLEVCSRVVSHAGMTDAILRIRESLLNNNPIGASFAKETKVFPPEFLTAVSIGESDLAKIFEKLAAHFSRESKNQIDMGIAAIEPAMAVLLGALGVLTGAAMILPSIQVMQKLGGG